MPPPEGTGPLVAGPSSAGPPPAIPAELPPPPAGAISISAVKLKEKEEEKNKGFDLSDLRRKTFTRTLRTRAGYGPDEKIAKTAMDDGKALFRTKKYKEAGVKFAMAADRWPDSPLGRRRSVPAKRKRVLLRPISEGARHDRRLVEEVSQHAAPRHRDRPRVRHGPLLGATLHRQADLAHHAQRDRTQPPDVRHVRLRRPGLRTGAHLRSQGPLADASLMALGNAYFRPRPMERRRLQLRSAHQGVSRQQTPVEGAFVGAPGEHAAIPRLGVRRHSAEGFRENRQDDAESVWQQAGRRARVGSSRRRRRLRKRRPIATSFVAEYYQGRHCYGAARLYYNGVVDEYPRHRERRKAKAELEKIRNEPDEPPALFGSLFGGKKR